MGQLSVTGQVIKIMLPILRLRNVASSCRCPLRLINVHCRFLPGFSNVLVLSFRLFCASISQNAFSCEKICLLSSVHVRRTMTEWAKSTCTSVGNWKFSDEEICPLAGYRTSWIWADSSAKYRHDQIFLPEFCLNK